MAIPSRADIDLDAEGAGGDLKANLLNRLGLHDEPCDAPQWRVNRLFRAIDTDMQPALHAFGYYRAEIDKTLTRDGDCWHATVAVNLGERTRIRQRDVRVQGEARDDLHWAELLTSLPLSPGESLHHGRYEDIKARLRDLAAERGYLDFAFTRTELRIHPDEAAADIVIEVDSGPRYRFGDMRFDAQRLDEDFVRRLAGLEAGTEYSPSALVAVDRNLSDSGYFQSVEVRALRDQAADLEVPVDVTLNPAKQHAWRFGLGYATDSGPRASLSYDNRYVNRRGHRWEGEVHLSTVESGLTADYLIPGEDPHRESYSVGLGLLREDSDTVDADSARLIVRHTLKTDGWTRTRFVELLHERSTVDEETLTSTLLMPGISFDRVKADDPFRTGKGYRINLEARAAHESLLSTASLLQLRATAKGIYRFEAAGRVTARADLGVTIGDSIGDLPASLRFFAGGDSSVRGYAYKSLGPLGDDGDVVGGKNLVTASLEYEHPVFGEDWWVGAFVDTGNAFDSEKLDLKTGVGVGLRWYSPVGRVRVDLAFPDDTEDDDWRLHFGLGADL